MEIFLITDPRPATWGGLDQELQQDDPHQLTAAEAQDWRT